MSCRTVENLIAVLTLCAAVAFGAGPVTAQVRGCRLKLAQLPDAPELYGFRLGMTQEQAKANVEQIRFEKADRFGVTKTTINPLFDSKSDKVRFADVRTISLDFLDGHLVSLWIGYEPTFKWRTLDEFVPGISKSLHLTSEWSSKRGGRQLMCDGVSLTAALMAGSPNLRLADEAAQETIATRREEDAAAAEAMVVGDNRTKVFYPSGCEASTEIPEANRITFKDRGEAEKAGFKLAKDCEQDLVIL